MERQVLLVRLHRSVPGPEFEQHIRALKERVFPVGTGATDALEHAQSLFELPRNLKRLPEVLLRAELLGLLSQRLPIAGCRLPVEAHTLEAEALLIQDERRIGS